MAVLAAAAGLFNVPAFGFSGFFYGFAVSHLRLAHVGFNFKFAFHPVNNDVQMQLAHATDNGLHGFFVASDPESRVFFS